jgi:hypothetical protein
VRRLKIRAEDARRVRVILMLRGMLHPCPCLAPKIRRYIRPYNEARSPSVGVLSHGTHRIIDSAFRE